ncbi:MAG TPA: YihY/virulence factor BrkB family protein [Thermodesulfobacteriota bacterium]|nr:YihY/virulence factor BrkB family protein [Thermodesulfobacteriota bacterium]
MSELVKRINYFFSRQLWRIDTDALGKRNSIFINIVRLTYLTIREYRENELALRAMSLVYTTLLSLVPLLAFVISILKAFGVVDNQLEPFLLNFLQPLDDKGVVITQRIMEFIGRINFGVLGIAGLVMLVYTAVSVITKIEDSMNIIWKIRKGRSIARRLSDYITTLIIGPVLIFAIFGVTATFSSNTIVGKLVNIEPLGTVLFAFGKVIPFIFVIIVFTVIYIIIPNTKVHIRSALVGGVAAGVAWHATSWIFHAAVASSTRYAAVYASLAVLIIFMIWLYLNWLIVLVGAEISFCHQNLKFITLRKEVFNLSTKLKEKLSLIIMYLIGYNYYYDLHRWTLESLTKRLRLPNEPVEEAVGDLTQKNLIVETADAPPCFVPSRALEKITLKEIIDATRTNYETDLVEKKYLSMAEVDAVTGRVESAINETLGEMSLKDLVLSENTPSSE